jgi:RNA polymerase sigma factor (sigma-70 family)
LRKSFPRTIIARQFRTLFQDGATGDLTDHELLERFTTRKADAAEAAFEALVERHGPMVLRVCRSILGDLHEAQDAFQLTFLLLARRAGSLWVRDSLAPWLHSVACRIASSKRAAEARRRGLERRFAVRLSESAVEPALDDLAFALHEEIERLPERLKAPLVLCYLEGLTHDRAADHLGCPVGTVRSRLSRGRDRLRRALLRRGFAPPSSTDGTAQTLTPIPPLLATGTIHAARIAFDRASLDPLARWFLFLSEGVLQPMMIHPLKTAAVILLASGAIATGLNASSSQEPKPPANSATVPRELTADEKRFEAIERRLREVEAELMELKASRLPFRSLSSPDQDTLHKIRPRFDNVLVEKVFVTRGQAVKKGEPLLEIRSAELGQAKNEFRTRFIQWDHDHKLLVAREPLAKDGRITQLLWTETQNNEKKSRLDYLVSREKLATYGMTNEQIDKLIEGLSDDQPGVKAAGGNIQDITRMTVVAPIDGVVITRDVVPGNFYNQTDVLFTITPPKP